MQQRRQGTGRRHCHLARRRRGADRAASARFRDAFAPQHRRQLAIDARQLRPHGRTQMLHPARADRRGHRALQRDGAQAAHIDVGPQRVAQGLGVVLALHCAHQRIQFRKLGSHGQQNRLLGPNQLDAFPDLLIADGFERIKAQDAGAARVSRDGLRKLGQQRLGIGFAQGVLVLHEDAGRFGQQVALQCTGHLGGLLRHRLAGPHHQLTHQHPALRRRFLHARTVQRLVGARLWAGKNGGHARCG